MRSPAQSGKEGLLLARARLLSERRDYVYLAPGRPWDRRRRNRAGGRRCTEKTGGAVNRLRRLQAGGVSRKASRRARAPSSANQGPGAMQYGERANPGSRPLAGPGRACLDVRLFPRHRGAARPATDVTRRPVARPRLHAHEKTGIRVGTAARGTVGPQLISPLQTHGKVQTTPGPIHFPRFNEASNIGPSEETPNRARRDALGMAGSDSWISFAGHPGQSGAPRLEGLGGEVIIHGAGKHPIFLHRPSV